MKGGSLLEDSKNASSSRKEEELTQSQKNLEVLIRMNPEYKVELQKFKSLIKNINKTLINQPKFLVESLLDQRYNLNAMKASTQE